ncbi:MAG: pseudaminic acid synthase [Endomicrobium sp.]|jgi:pseudaminic acid synthase|nr:pseudaminic acid synthase [Endomicrobium sp.]
MDKTFIIAELSANHNGSKATALATIKAAKRAGADAIKLQTYTADTITLNVKMSDFETEKGSLWQGRYLYDLYKEAYTPWEWHEELFDAAHKEGLVCFSTPFDKSAVDFLETIKNPIYKIASFEITDIPLIEYAARKNKPMIISTGIATQEDIRLAIDTCLSVGNNDITLLKCTSQYPATLEDANLYTIADMAQRFGVKVGLSDHTMGWIAPVTAVALGAKVIEKHFIIDRSIGGADSAFSMDEKEFTEMVKYIRDAEKSLGKIDYPADISKIKGRNIARSLYIAQDMKAGDIITEQNVRSVRPGYGLHPKYWKEIQGKKINRDVKKGERFAIDMLLTKN